MTQNQSGPEAAELLTVGQQDAALAIVAEWLGEAMGLDGPAPTGRVAADRAAGPMLVRDWEPTWSGAARPTAMLEGGPGEWAIDISLDEEAIAKFRAVGVLAEPWAGWALCFYPY
jgi:hypothetical protein